MENQYFSLEISENNRLTKIFRIIFGVICLIVAVFWLIFNVKLLETDKTLWITIVFLSGFGLYQIWSGLGYAVRFIEIGSDNIRLKKNAILPAVQMMVPEIEKIELFPLSIIFFLKSGKRIILRLGTTYHETNDKIVDVITGFAESNKISFEIREEKL